MVCAEALDFSDALFLLHERGKAMQEAVPVGNGSMIAILGANIDEIKNLIQTNKKKKLSVKLQMIMLMVKL